MAQVKVYGIDELLRPVRQKVSDSIHACVVEALRYPADKRNHRFFPMAKEDLFPPDGRTDAYTIIEITMIAGRSTDARKKLVRLLYERITVEVGITPIDIEISILEIPAENWGFRGQHGDEVKLSYSVDV